MPRTRASRSSRPERARRQQRAAAAVAAPAPPAALEPAAVTTGSKARLPAWWLAALFAGGALVRLGVLQSLRHEPLFERPQLDSLEFLIRARSIAGGELLRGIAGSHAPGYSYFLGGLLAALHGSFLAAQAVQALLGAVTCCLVAAIGARLFGDRRAGIVAGGLAAICGPLVYIEVSLFAEGLFVLLLTAALLLLVRPVGVASAAAAGALVGMAAAVRGTALTIVPVLVIVGAMVVRMVRGAHPTKSDIDTPSTVRTGYHPVSPASLAALLLGWLLVVVPVLVLVRHQYGSWLPMQSFGGMNAYMGNHPGASGTPEARPGFGWDQLIGEPLRAGITGTAEREAYFTRKLRAELRAQPLALVPVLLRKTMWLLQADEIRDAYHFFASRSPLLRWLPGWGLLLPLAGAGLWLLLRQRRVPLALAVYLVLLALSCVGLVVSARYRIPLVPCLAALGGGGAVALWDGARRRDWRAIAPLAGIVIALAVVSHLWRHAPSHDLSEEWVLTAMSQRALERPQEAEAALAEALRQNPRSPFALQQQGALELSRGELAAAAAHLHEAATLAPGDERVHTSLAELLRQQGDLDGSERELRQAVAILPDEITARRALAALLLARGNQAEAAEEYATITRFHPRDSEAWLLQAVLALDSRQTERAAEALDHAAGLLAADDPRLLFAQARLQRQQRHFDESRGTLERLLHAHPEIEAARRLLAMIEIEAGEAPLAP